MEIRSLRPEELDAWAAHCGTVFSEQGHGVDKSYFLRHFNDDPWRDCNGIFVAVDDGKIVSTVRVFRRRVWLLGSAVTMGGIGEVSTNPAYRGQGLAGMLLTKSVEWMRQEGLAVSVLYTGLHDFYRRYGWECLPVKLIRYAGAQGVPCEGRAMKPDDLYKLKDVNAVAAKADWSVVRDSIEYWDMWMKAAIGKAVVATEGDAVVAWMAYRTFEDDWSVTEFKALPGYEYKFEGLCTVAATLEGREAQALFAPAWVQSGRTDCEPVTASYTMVRLNIPFAAWGRQISSTEQLIETTKECRDSGLDHF